MGLAPATQVLTCRAKDVDAKPSLRTTMYDGHFLSRTVFGINNNRTAGWPVGVSMAKNSGAGDFDPSTILNQGVIARTVPHRVRRRASPEKTLLITGLARSGTSMLAAMLQAAGVWLGDHVYEPINEDAEITQMLRARDLFRLDALIKRQNAKAPIWGFKMPDLHQFLQHDELTRFRNPHLIVIFRDPVAIAVRNVVSEHVDGAQAMVEATSATHSLTRFVLASHLPFLFLSYEKALLFPRVFVDSVLSFCGVTWTRRSKASCCITFNPTAPSTS